MQHEDIDELESLHQLSDANRSNLFTHVTQLFNKTPFFRARLRVSDRLVRSCARVNKDWKITKTSMNETWGEWKVFCLIQRDVNIVINTASGFFLKLVKVKSNTLHCWPIVFHAVHSGILSWLLNTAQYVQYTPYYCLKIVSEAKKIYIIGSFVKQVCIALHETVFNTLWLHPEITYYYYIV